jgi:hypothetical protein
MSALISGEAAYFTVD